MLAFHVDAHYGLPPYFHLATYETSVGSKILTELSLCYSTIIMVLSGTSSSYRWVDWIGF